MTACPLSTLSGHSKQCSGDDQNEDYAKHEKERLNSEFPVPFPVCRRRKGEQRAKDFEDRSEHLFALRGQIAVLTPQRPQSTHCGHDQWMQLSGDEEHCLCLWPACRRNVS
jgi:hypothetical protein